MGGTNIKKSEALEVLSTKIQCYVRTVVLEGLSHLRPARSFDLLTIYNTYIRKRVEYVYFETFRRRTGESDVAL